MKRERAQKIMIFGDKQNKLLLKNKVNLPPLD
jgi:hypothetical protein